MIPPLFNALGAKYNLPDEITHIIIQYVKTHVAKAFVNEDIESDICQGYIASLREIYLKEMEVVLIHFQLQAGYFHNMELNFVTKPGTWRHLHLKLLNEF